MFLKKDKIEEQPAEGEAPQRRLEDQGPGETAVAPGSEVRGTITGLAGVRIAGFFEGEVKIGGLAWIEPGGRIKGNIQAAGAIVEGEINGQIQTNGRVEIRQSGRVIGNILCEKIAVAEGCFFQGEIRMPREGEQTLPFQEKRKKGRGGDEEDQA